MFTIGEFARHGRVSIRMLRHYDAVGLLQPALVDRQTGYRSYQAEQLSRLNRIVALKELGFTLQQVQSILDEEVSVEELHGMLRLRQAELQSRMAADAARLAQVRVRIQSIETGGGMPSDDVQLKRLPAVRVAELTGRAGGFEPAMISPVIGPLYDELIARLQRAGITPVGPGIAYYDDLEGEVLVHASLPVAVESADGVGVGIIDLAEIPCAATIVHRGSMDDVMPTIQTLARWIDANGYRSAGPPRELYLETGPDRHSWVTELQEPITR
jgi:DNA-binding transcriptional MerR regulator